MNAAELLATVTALGATIKAVDDRLRIEAPPGAITPELRAALAEQKGALLTLLREPPRVRAHLCAGCRRHFFPEPARLCFWCRKDQGVRRVG